jgi:hypothetical protein
MQKFGSVVIYQIKEHKMKIITLSILFTAIMLITTNSSTSLNAAKRTVHPLEESQATKTMEPPEGKAIIYVIQDFRHRVQEKTASAIYVDKKYIGNVGNFAFLYTIVDPGTHQIHSSGLFGSKKVSKLKREKNIILDKQGGLGQPRGLVMLYSKFKLGI